MSLHLIIEVIESMLYFPYTIPWLWTIFSVTLSLGYILQKRIFTKQDTFWEDQGVTVFKNKNVSLFRLIFRGDINKIQQEIVQEHGKLFGSYQRNRRILNVSEPEMIKTVLTKEFYRFTSKGFQNIFPEPIIKKMLVMLDDPDDWKRTRMVVSPSFSTGKLRRMQPLLDECVETMLANIEKQAKNGPIDVAKVSNAFTLDVVISVAFGTKIDSLNDKNNPLAAYSGNLLNKWFFFAARFPRLSKIFGIEPTNSKAFAFYKNFATQLINQRRNQKVKRNDFLQLMVDAEENAKSKDDVKDEEIDEVFKLDNIKLHNKTLSLDEIISQCVLFFVAGTDTTAAGLTGAIYSLATNPETQQKLYEEVAPLFEKGTTVDYDSVYPLQYLDAVLSESLRIYPPAPQLQREAHEDCQLSDGSRTIHISKGTEIRVPIYAMLQDPENFEQPEQFRPERFFPENRKHHPYAYLPFGGGPRICVGQRLAMFEAKLALAHWVYNYRTSAVPETRHPPKVSFTFGAMSPSDVILKVERRRK